MELEGNESGSLVPRYAMRGSKRVWLTLDDGPHPTRTVKILTALKKHNIRAIFFVVGKNVSAYPDVVKRAFDAGHRIGNHSYTHPDLTRLSETKIRSELQRTDDLISKYAGQDKIFRPPYGAHNRTVDSVAASLGYRIILWSVDTVDWSPRYQPDRWVQHGVDQIRARSTSVVLGHDIHKTTADNYDLFITRIKGIGGVTLQPPSTL